jgi:CheY-like chemotaxis protein
MTSVLVVDDDPGIRDLLAEVLEMEGYDVLTAGDGAQALALVRQEAPSAILLDLMMPVMTGWDFIDACSAEALCQDVPLLVISAATDLDSASQKQRLRAARSVLAKPFNLDKVISEVERYAPADGKAGRGLS